MTMFKTNMPGMPSMNITGKDIGPTSPQDVTKAFTEFLQVYDKFRNDNNLSGKIDNVHEVMTAMLDKLGRMAQYIKHQERNDPKDNWRQDICTELTGLYIYSIILMNNYELDISEGMLAELEKSVDQHGDKYEKALKHE